MPELIKFSIPLLSLTLFIPLLGAVIIMLFIPKQRTSLIKWFAFIISVIDFLVSLPLVKYFDPSTNAMQFVEQHSWIPSIGVEYFLGIDRKSTRLNSSHSQ